MRNMKQLKFYSLALVVMLTTLFCKAQTKQNDTLKITSGIDLTSGSSGIIIKDRLPLAEIKYDTVRVVMLVSDTLHYSNEYPTLKNGNYFDKSGFLSWVTGFVVIKKEVTKWYGTLYDSETYLDGFMEPLSSYIIVWLVKYGDAYKYINLLPNR